MSLETRLQKLNLTLPNPPKPLGAYVSAVEAGGLLFLSGMLPVKEGRPAFIGRVGVELSLEEGRQAARLAALNGLAVVWSLTGSLDRIVRLVRLVAHIASASEFGDHAIVADGASELLASVFDGHGSHTRVAVGVVSLPAHMPIELEMVFELG